MFCRVTLSTIFLLLVVGVNASSKFSLRGETKRQLQSFEESECADDCPSPDSATDVTYSRTGLDRVSYNDPDRHPDFGRLPSKIYLESDPLPYFDQLSSIKIVTNCNDQDWGNTGHGEVFMVIDPPDHVGPSIQRRLFHIDQHGWEERTNEYQLSSCVESDDVFDQELADAIHPGSTIQVVMETEYWGGWATQCDSATITFAYF